MPKEGSLWYLLGCHVSKIKEKGYHTNHSKPVAKHINVIHSRMNERSTKRLKELCKLGMDGPTIKKVIKNDFDMTITQNTIAIGRKNYLSDLFDALEIDPSETASERLIAYFRSQKNISFMYVLHDMNSSFVTMRKAKRDRSQDPMFEKVPINEDEVGVSEIEMLAWREKMGVSDNKKFLVSIAWVHDEDLRLIFMFPEFLGVNVTFGGCIERRNLFRFCGIDGNMKVFSAMNCFMPSKQHCAYIWCCQVAFKELVTIEVLSWNRCIASD